MFKSTLVGRKKIGLVTAVGHFGFDKILIASEVRQGA
jgi:hypothetical protein